MIRVTSLNKSFNDQSVLSNISVSFEAGKTNLIIGRSGSGKTVLLKSIVGLHDIDSGEIWYDDMLFNKLDFQAKERDQERDGNAVPGKRIVRFTHSGAECEIPT